MIIRELRKTPRAVRRSKALILFAWGVTLGVCGALAMAQATPTSGVAWAPMGVSVFASLVAWLRVREARK